MAVMGGSKVRNFIYASSLVLLALFSPAVIAQNHERAPDCANQSQFGEWLWCPVQALVRVWGLPQTLKTLSNGNKIMLYHQLTYQHQLAHPIITPVFDGRWSGSVRNMPGQSDAHQQHLVRVECVNWFEIDPRGIIVRVNYSQKYCPDRFW